MLKYALLIFSSLLLLHLSAQQTRKTASEHPSSAYIIQDSVMIKTRDGTFISAIVVRKKADDAPKPAVLQNTIYVRDYGRDMTSLKECADRGYVGVIAYSRGKRFGTDEILPYENDGTDAYDVIDWISRQSWCNGSVGMFGGSYNGFTQWAACKKLHPALKTIVPYVANRPGMGLPMENNVFVNPNYEWAFYVANDRYLDTITANNRQRFRTMQWNWWYSGVSYNKLDSIDGYPNRLFQRWITHPSFDEYWQKMAPYENDFAQITIPVVAIDGYYNDSQNSGLYYLRELEKYNPKANYYLIIGPYGHFGAQRGGEEVINGYTVDKDARIDTKAITYEWLDHILKNGPRPAILKDRVNYQVMGANEWRSASSLSKIYNEHLTFYLSDQASGSVHSLNSKKPGKSGFLGQTVDFTDREHSNNDYYPDPIIRKTIDTTSGFIFISEPIQEQMLINGSFVGEIRLSINKKDLDLGLTLYELMPDGEYFHLGYYIGRASYSADITRRNLLTPGKKESIPFSNTKLVSRQLSKGSRLVIYLDVNKNSFSQLNYGSGKDVSTENMNDSGEPLTVKWYNDSFVKIPVLRVK